MSLLDIVRRIPHVGLEIFRHLDLNDIDTCRVVCRDLLHFVDNVVYKSHSLTAQLELGHRRQRWMWGEPLARIPIDFTCDEEVPKSQHFIERTCFMDGKLVLLVYTPRTGLRSILTYDDEGGRVGWVIFPGMIQFWQRTKSSLLLIMEGQLPSLLYNMWELEGYHCKINQENIVDLGGVGEHFYLAFQEDWKSPIFIEVRHPSCIMEITKSFKLEHLHEPDENSKFCYSSKWIMIHYTFKREIFLDVFDIETGERKHTISGTHKICSDGFKQPYIDSDFLAPDFAVLFETEPKLVDLATFQLIEAFRHVKMVNFRRTWSNRVRTFFSLISNRFAVRIMEKESHRPVIWVIWIGDLVTKKERKFSAVADLSRLSCAEIVDDVILVMYHPIRCQSLWEKKKDGQFVNGRLTAYDLCETNEEKFWEGKVELGHGRIGWYNRETLGSFGILTTNHEPGNQRIIMRLPFKRSHRM